MDMEKGYKITVLTPGEPRPHSQVGRFRVNTATALGINPKF